MKVKIYTKTGDKGETSLFSGDRVPKNDPFIEALGSVDELNSTIGAALSLLPKKHEMSGIKEQLETIQHALFDLGASVATPQTKSASSKIEKTRFDMEAIALLETWIDGMEKDLPELHAFILPGGDPSGAMLHLARSICRRAERRVLPLHKNGDVSNYVVIYLNRLSDYLFSLSRYVNQHVKTPEIQWKPHKIKSEII